MKSTIEREQMEAFLPGSITAGTQAGYAAKWTRWLGSQVVFVSMTYWTSKTKNKTVSLDEKDSGDLLMLNDLVEWIVESRVETHDLLTTRYWQGNKRTVLRKEVREAIKTVCHKLGLPQKHFSTKSLRSGFATHYKRCDGDIEHRNARGGWAPGSMVPDTKYDFNVPRGAFSLGSTTSSGLTVEGMRSLIPSDSAREGRR